MRNSCCGVGRTPRGTLFSPTRHGVTWETRLLEAILTPAVDELGSPAQPSVPTWHLSMADCTWQGLRPRAVSENTRGSVFIA